jgi:hypothetical protein
MLWTKTGLSGLAAALLLAGCGGNVQRAGPDGKSATSASSSASSGGGGGGAPAGASGASSNGAGAGASSSSSGGPIGSVGDSGGTIPTLSFAIVGGARPPSQDASAAYPTAILTKIWQDVEAYSPRPAFALTTGDYTFASPQGNQAVPQTDLYVNARSAFSNVVFPAMGVHECDGVMADNCGACGSGCSAEGTCVGGVCQTPTYSAFVSQMLAPIGESLPYYTIHVDGTGGAWTAKFVIVACNAWSPAQATWLDTELATPTTYTFVVRHEDSTYTTAPCLSGVGLDNAATIMSQHPYTLLIAGHPNTFEYFASEKEVVVGNGGAPLGGTADGGVVDYGYVIAQQQPSGDIQLDELDYATNTVQATFSVSP